MVDGESYTPSLQIEAPVNSSHSAYFIQMLLTGLWYMMNKQRCCASKGLPECQGPDSNSSKKKKMQKAIGSNGKIAKTKACQS